MNVRQLIEQVCTPSDDGADYVLVVFTASRKQVKPDAPEMGMWFDIVGPFEDVNRAEQQIIKILERYKLPAYNVQRIDGDLRNEIVVTPTVGHFERDLYKRGYRRC